MKPTVEVTEGDFGTEVLKSRQPVLVEFATGCFDLKDRKDGSK
jgi:hypothetical protein